MEGDKDTKPIFLKEAKKNYEKYRNSEVRFSLKVYVTSSMWTTNDKKSFWVEDPKQDGKTIMCTYRSECEAFDKMKFRGQYFVSNVKIARNLTKDLPTYAEYQIILDEESEIFRAKKEPIIYQPIDNLAEIPELVSTDSIGEFLDIIAKPVWDFDSHTDDESSPRRIKMVDNSGQDIVWTLWNEDKDNIEEIQKLMDRPLLFRNAIVKYYDDCGFDEWQMRASLCNVVTKHPLIEKFENRMKSRTDEPGPFADLVAHFGKRTITRKQLQKFLEEKSKKNSETKKFRAPLNNTKMFWNGNRIRSFAMFE